MFQQRKQEVIDKVAVLVAKAEARYSIKLPQIQIRFDLRGRTAGMAGQRWGTYFMRFNVDMMLNQAWDHLINDTVPHELAHICCFVAPHLGRNHDYGWKSVCRALGGGGERCHSEEVVYAHGTVYYTSTTGHVIAVSKQRHTKIQRGASYTWRGGKGSVNRACQYSARKPDAAQHTPAAVAPVVAPAIPAVAPVAPRFTVTPIPAPTFALGGGSNADKVRARIALAKRNGEDQEAVVQWAVANLGQSRQLARSYVKNNWPKVL